MLERFEIKSQKITLVRATCHIANTSDTMINLEHQLTCFVTTMIHHENQVISFVFTMKHLEH